jgi:CTP synthase (UTP-ammonia lyase)
MTKQIKVGIIGDYDPKKSPSHIPTNEALNHAADKLSISLNSTWLPTMTLETQSLKTTMKGFDALWGAPGGPFESRKGVFEAIRFARERQIPFIAT